MMACSRLWCCLSDDTRNKDMYVSGFGGRYKSSLLYYSMFGIAAGEDICYPEHYLLSRGWIPRRVSNNFTRVSIDSHGRIQNEVRGVEG